MSKRYDKVIKELLKDVMVTLITKVIGLKVVKSTAIETKLQITNEREADFIIRVELEDGSKSLLHIEFQATNFTQMVYRELWYWVYIVRVLGIAPIQYVFYIGNEPLTMKDSISTETITYRYNLIDMRDVDCDTFLHSDKPEEVIISILCNYQKKGVKIFIREILQRIKELVPEETLRGKYIRQVEVLSQLRDLQGEVCKEAEDMALVYDLERDVRFRQGREQGLLVGEQRGEQRGERKGIIEGMLEIKFGSAGVALMDMVGVVDSADKLEALKNLIRKADSLEELKGFLEKAI